RGAGALLPPPQAAMHKGSSRMTRFHMQKVLTTKGREGPRRKAQVAPEAMPGWPRKHRTAEQLPTKQPVFCGGTLGVFVFLWPNNSDSRQGAKTPRKTGQFLAAWRLRVRPAVAVRRGCIH